jgi:neutral ceramidase
MSFRKLTRVVLTSLVMIVALLVLFLAFSLAPVDRTPARELDFYQEMKHKLAALDSVVIPHAVSGFSVGYAKTDLTPSSPVSLAGYSNRRGNLFTSVHDSIYVRAMVIGNGVQKVAVVSADLLLIPPTVYERLESRIADTGFSLDQIYLGATHTHNSIGNWGEGATRFIYGAYRDDIVDFITDNIISCIREASANMVPASLRAGVISVPQAVSNRLVRGGPKDSLLRVMEVRRSDSSKLLLMSYTAHATCLYSKDLELSRDYPGKLVDTLEAQGYDFAMFMAGAVGSHKCTPPEYGPNCMDWMAGEISGTFLSQRSQLKEVNDSTLFMLRVPLLLSDPQAKITPGWKVRPWLIRAAFGEYPVWLTALRIGDMMMLGTPCDFSGEFNFTLDSLASKKGLQFMVTSFNGGYIGYVTPVKYYDREYFETQIMNWYAPGTGEYMEECMEKLVEIVNQ